MAQPFPPSTISIMEAPSLLETHPHLEDNSVKLEVKTENFELADLGVIEKRESSPSDSQSSPSTSTPTPGQSNIKRTTRKSTLTQQQKNQKRQRATQDQLNTLEVEFTKNPTPNAAIRERIASEINMTERSVQIWFQNRRAKIKNMAKKSYESGEDMDIPDSMRKYLAMQAMETGNMGMPDYFAPNGMPAYPPGIMMNPETSPKVMISHFPCRSLTIGSWRRIGQTQLDLVVFYSPTKSMMTYYIQAESTGFRIEYPFSHIKNISLESSGQSSSAEVGASDDSYILVELHQPPLFTMDQGSSGWFQCRDFTEDQQASNILMHRLGGNAKALGAQLSKLTSTDAYRCRFEASDVKPQMGPPLAPPMSTMPIMEQRPSSQPNHLVHPHAPNFNDRSFGPVQKMGPPAEPPRGHKRQRSSSVPMAINFGARRQPITPFTLNQHYHQHNHIHHHNNPANFPEVHGHIFSPVPQYPAQPMPYPQQQQGVYGQMGPPLHIDVSAGFNFDFGVPPPPSATTGTTPPSSEFEQNLYPPSGMADLYSAPPTQTAFSGTFLSPVLGSPGMPGHSMSPASVHDQQPVLQPSAILSPPNTLFRSHSADPRVQHNGDYQEYLPDVYPINAENYAENARFFSGFEDSKFNFIDGINWPAEDNAALDALLVDQPLRSGHSRMNSMNLAFRLSADRPMVPPSPLQEAYEFSDLVSLEPLSPHGHQTTTTMP